MTDAVSSLLTRSLGSLLPNPPPIASGFSLDNTKVPELLAQAPAPVTPADARINGILMNATPEQKEAIEPLLAAVRSSNPQALPRAAALIPQTGEKVIDRDFDRAADSLYILLSVLAEPSMAKEAEGMFQALAENNAYVVAGRPSLYGGSGAQAVTLLNTDWKKIDRDPVNGPDTPVKGTVIVLSPYTSDLPGTVSKLGVNPQDTMRYLRNETFHAITANAEMSKAAADGQLPEPYQKVAGAWERIQGFDFQIASSVQETIPFGTSESPKFADVEKSIIETVKEEGYRNLKEYFADAYGTPLVLTAKAALEGKAPEVLSDLIRRFVAPNLAPEDAARYDAFMNDLLDKTKTAIREYEKEKPGAQYERLNQPILDKVSEAIGGDVGR